MSTLAGFHRFTAIFYFPVHGKPGNSAVFSLLCLYFAFILPIGKSAPLEKVDSSFWGKTIQRIEFSADLPLERSQYAPHIGIRPGDLLTRTSVKNAIRYLYDSGRFSYIAVEAFPEGNAVFLQFNLRYNHYFNRFSIKGDIDLKGRYLWELVTLPTGQRFTEDKLEEARQAVLAFLPDRTA
jgi:outer membrane protein assembly factor BamA